MKDAVTIGDLIKKQLLLDEIKDLQERDKGPGLAEHEEELLRDLLVKREEMGFKITIDELVQVSTLLNDWILNLKYRHFNEEELAKIYKIKEQHDKMFASYFSQNY